MEICCNTWNYFIMASFQISDDKTRNPLNQPINLAQLSACCMINNLLLLIPIELHSEVEWTKRIMSEWVIRTSSRSWQFCSLITTGTRFTKLNGFGLWTRSCLHVVCIYWTCFVLVRPAARLYSASPLTHTPRVGSDVPTETIILTPSRPVGL